MKDNIGLVFATKIESKAFVKGFSLKSIEKTPFNILSDNKIFLIISGIGKANAAMAASYLINTYNTKIIFNIGAAGATTDAYKVGDIFHINKVVEYDRPRLLKKGVRILKPDLLAGFNFASLATQDRPVIDPGHREEVSKHADLVDMEGASVIQACRLFNAECYLFKVVTDTPEHHEIEIVKNIYATAEKMFEFFNLNIFNNKNII
jgi:adenosylhomocysteine nucleosidase